MSAAEPQLLKIVCTGKGRHVHVPHWFTEIQGRVAADSWVGRLDVSDDDRWLTYVLHRSPQLLRMLALGIGQAAALPNAADRETFTPPLNISDFSHLEITHAYEAGTGRTPWEFRCPHPLCASLDDEVKSSRPVRCNEKDFQLAIDTYRATETPTLDVSMWQEISSRLRHF